MHPPPPHRLKTSLNDMPATGDACCTCAALLATAPRFTSGSEKPLPEPRALSCCDRTICGSCLYTNARFAHYCPYCQTSPSPALLPTGLKTPRDKTSINPPSPTTISTSSPLSPASATSASSSSAEKSQDTVHYLNHANDTLPSLSLAYNVPAPILRRHNNLPADHLLAARRTLLIPASHYPAGQPSLSPRPVESEPDLRRKAALRRFMVACKVADYDVATLYLEQASYDLRRAVETWEADAAWERAHPQDARDRDRARAKGKAPAAKGGSWWKIL